MGVEKYLGESYYHRIKCFVAISEQCFLALQVPPKTSGGCWWAKDQHMQSNVHVEGKDEKGDVV